MKYRAVGLSRRNSLRLNAWHTGIRRGSRWEWLPRPLGGTSAVASRGACRRNLPALLIRVHAVIDRLPCDGSQQ